MQTRTKVLNRLALARETSTIVKLNRMSAPYETLEGFVVAIGRKWVLVAPIASGGFFDGYAVIRVREIARVRFDRSFQRRFSETRPEWPVNPPPGRPMPDLDSTRGMLRSFLAKGVLCAIERRNKPDLMWVGVPDQLRRHWLYLLEVRSDATWHAGPLGYRLRTITLVRMGDQYLRALAAVAGLAPVEAGSSW
ncbi:hypothetical protein SAMN06295974_2546 [Plantibacter flavus]|uniref:Uncharacterized protein n=1 Tax=Plantibacter flavus TaxID=150123 RepID=A0A3N2BZ15_9MICO|nr:hypothetical protein [Plantibacter flavus]ROR80294.1 hypothetical protein EDD42_0332 [Plantibacter flavus]SMG35566.1 hypothetical protein SAMN06295974_2546 [Plantibacter flavus]